MDSRARIWTDINVPSGLGLDCGRYKWWQNQSYVEALFLIPENVTSKQVGPHGKGCSRVLKSAIAGSNCTLEMTDMACTHDTSKMATGQ